MQDKYGREYSPEHGEHCEEIYNEAHFEAMTARINALKSAKYRIVEVLYEYGVTTFELKTMFGQILEDVQWNQDRQTVKELFLNAADVRERAGQRSIPDRKD